MFAFNEKDFSQQHNWSEAEHGTFINLCPLIETLDICLAASNPMGLKRRRAG